MIRGDAPFRELKSRDSHPGQRHIQGIPPHSLPGCRQEPRESLEPSRGQSSGSTWRLRPKKQTDEWVMHFSACPAAESKMQRALNAHSIPGDPLPSPDAAAPIRSEQQNPLCLLFNASSSPSCCCSEGTKSPKLQSPGLNRGRSSSCVCC